MKELIAQISEDIDGLQNVLDDAKKDYSSDPDLFYKLNIFKMSRFIRLYSELMKHLGTKLNEDAIAELAGLDEDLLAKLEKFKAEWNDFLKNVETKISQKNDDSTKSILSDEIIQSHDYFQKNIDNDNFKPTSLFDMHKEYRNTFDISGKKSYMHLVMLRHFA